MRLLIIVWGACLLSVSAGLAAEGSADRSGGPPWSNSPADSSRYPEPADASTATVIPAVYEVRADESTPGHLGQPTEFAPDPPPRRHADAVQAAFEQEVAPASDKAKAFDATTAAASRPAVPRRLHAENAEDANPVRPAYDQPAATPATATAQPLPAAAQPAPTASLSLGSHSDKNLSSKTSPLSAAITVGGSLALVLGLFLLVAWVMRKTAPRGSILLPREVFEILGRAPLGARQQVQLLRCGNKLLLVSIMPGGAETLTEVTDPLEVDRLAGICQQANPKSSTMAFRQVFQQLAPKSGEPSALEVESPGSRKRRYRWEEKHA